MDLTSNGTVTRDGERCVLRFRRRLGHPIPRVWAALTEPEQLAAWWGDAEIDLVEGGKFRLRWRNTDEAGNAFTMDAVITRLRPPHLLVTRAREHGELRWALRADGEATELEFSSTVELPEDILAKVLAGWHWHLDALARALDGERSDLVGLPGWDSVHQNYR